MSDFARGRDVLIQVLGKDTSGKETILNLGRPTSAEFRMDAESERDERLGVRESPTVQNYMGDSGSMTFKTDSHVLHEIQMRIRNAARNGEKTPKFRILVTVYVPEIASSKTMVIPDVVFTPSTTASDRNSAVETQLEWLGGMAFEL